MYVRSKSTARLFRFRIDNICQKRPNTARRPLFARNPRSLDCQTIHDRPAVEEAIAYAALISIRLEAARRRPRELTRSCPLNGESAPTEEVAETSVRLFMLFC